MCTASVRLAKNRAFVKNHDIPKPSALIYRMVPLRSRVSVALLTLAVAGSASAQADYSNAYNVTTLAGHAITGLNRDGASQDAEIGDGNGVAIDAAGNLYIADGGHHTIRKVTPGGVVSTIAGKADQPGTADGVGTDAQFNTPDGIAVDTAGNVFVADRRNHSIRKITPAGVVSTFAGKTGTAFGGPVFGSPDGVGEAARFYEPSGLAFDRQGNLYVADSANQTIRKITPAGVVTTLAGHPITGGKTDGVGDAARFFYPHGLVVDVAGNIYVADSNNYTIRKITSDGTVSTLAGRNSSGVVTPSVDGIGSAATFGYPYNIAIGPDGALYVTDNQSSAIRRVTTDGVVTTIAGKSYGIGSADGTAGAARFNYPSGVVLESSGSLAVTDSGSHTVRRVSPAGLVSTIVGTASLGSDDGAAARARFHGPSGVVRDELGNCYVTDSLNHVIRKIAADGSVSTVAGLAGEKGSTDGVGTAARFNFPTGIARDRAGNLYVADAGNDLIRKISPPGVVSTLAGQAGVAGARDGTGSAALFNSPAGLAVDAAGYVYVADSGSNEIRKISPAGQVQTLAGQAYYFGPDMGGAQVVVPTGYTVDNVDGAGRAARFSGPSGLAIDGWGNLYVADSQNATIRKVTPEGAVTTLAGLPGRRDSVDGPVATAKFNRPLGIAVDEVGTIYVAEGKNVIGFGESGGGLIPGSAGQVIRRITRAGVVTTLAGRSAASGADDGTGAEASFNTPNGLDVDWAGNLLVADSDNNTVRRASPATRTAQLVNISVRTYCGTGNNVSIGGFVISGAPKRVLIRAVGPTLSTLGLAESEVLADPTIELHHGDDVIARNDNWGDNADSAAITDAGATLGAGRLSAGDTKSAALLLTLDPGAYTFVVSGKGGTSGIALLELYDAEPGQGGSLANISARAFCGHGNAVTIGGLVIAGNGVKRVMLRAVGPTLAKLGLAEREVLADPSIELHEGSAIVATNDDGRDSRSFPALGSANLRLGASPLDAADVKSSAALYALDADAYSFIATGHDGGSGVVLVEIYDAD